MREKFFDPLHNIEISPIVRIAERARQVEPEYQERTGKKFIHLERCELNLNTPKMLIDNIKNALDEGKTKYPKSGGEVIFKEQLVKKLRDKNNIPDKGRYNKRISD